VPSRVPGVHLRNPTVNGSLLILKASGNGPAAAFPLRTTNASRTLQHGCGGRVCDDAPLHVNSFPACLHYAGTFPVGPSPQATVLTAQAYSTAPVSVLRRRVPRLVRRPGCTPTMSGSWPRGQRRAEGSTANPAGARFPTCRRTVGPLKTKVTKPGGCRVSPAPGTHHFLSGEHVLMSLRVYNSEKPKSGVMCSNSDAGYRGKECTPLLALVFAVWLSCLFIFGSFCSRQSAGAPEKESRQAVRARLSFSIPFWPRSSICHAGVNAQGQTSSLSAAWALLATFLAVKGCSAGRLTTAGFATRVSRTANNQSAQRQKATPALVNSDQKPGPNAKFRP